MSTEEQQEQIRIAIESAANRALEAGWLPEDVRREFEYVLEIAEDES